MTEIRRFWCNGHRIATEGQPCCDNAVLQPSHFTLDEEERTALVRSIEGECRCSPPLKAGAHFNDCPICVGVDLLGALQDEGYRLVKP